MIDVRTLSYKSFRHNDGISDHCAFLNLASAEDNRIFYGSVDFTAAADQTVADIRLDAIAGRRTVTRPSIHFILTKNSSF